MALPLSRHRFHSRREVSLKERLVKKKKRKKDWCFHYFVEFDLLITKVTFFVT